MEADAVQPVAVLAPDPLSPDTLVTLLAMVGNEDFRSEEVIAYELGYRLGVADRLSVDLAAFYNEYDELRTMDMAPRSVEQSPEPHYLLPMVLRNNAGGYTYGAELALGCDPIDGWRLKAGYSYLRTQLTVDEPKLWDSEMRLSEGEGPRHQASAHSWLNLPRGFSLDLGLRFVGDLSSRGVDSYSSVDSRVAWIAAPFMEISLVGRDLLNEGHVEMSSMLPGGQDQEVRRSLYGMITWLR